MIKIHSQDKIIFLIDDQKLFQHSESAILVEVMSEDELRILYDELLNKSMHEIYFFHPDISALFEFFGNMFKIVRAAGGLVQNRKGEWLFIFRNGKWDLPKGKVEKGEEIRSAATREVEEECGISGLVISAELEPTYHTYVENGKKIMKPTYWFLMDCSDDSVLVPQKEEGITDVKWIKAANLEKVRENTFNSILQVMEAITVNANK